MHLDWEVSGGHEDRVHLQAGQKRVKDEQKDADVLPKFNKDDMSGMMEAINEYQRLHCGLVRAPLANIIKTTIIFQTYDNYPKYATPEDDMITQMLHLPQNKNRLHNEQSAQSVMECLAKYEIDNRNV